MTYPSAVKRNHIVVSDWTYPRLATWPSSELETIRKFLWREGPSPPTRTLGNRIEWLTESIEGRCGLLEYMYMRRDLYLFYAVAPESDQVLHIALGGDRQC